MAGRPGAPEATKGKPQRLKLFLYSKSAKRDAPSGGARRVKADATSGLQQAHALAGRKQAEVVCQGHTEVTAQMIATQTAEAARLERLLQQTRAVHLVSEAKRSGPPSKLIGRPNTTDVGSRTETQRTYRQPIPRLSTTAPSLCDGDNTKLKFYSNFVGRRSAKGSAVRGQGACADARGAPARRRL